MRDRSDGPGEQSPAVVVLHSGDPACADCLREIDAGMEEEGVPVRVRESDLTTARELAHAAALASNLDVGIGVDADGAICVHHAKLPRDSPALVGAADTARTMGHNAARLVSGIPFKPAPASDRRAARRP